MKIKTNIGPVDTTTNSPETPAQHSSTPARVNLGVGNTQDRLEAVKANPLDLLFAEAKPQIDGIKQQISEIEQDVLALEAVKKKLENIGDKLNNPGLFITPNAIENYANDTNEGTNKSLSSFNEVSKKLLATEDDITKNLK
ncbi:MAG TPA: hypothetical protein VH815_15130 [Acidobacteriota bacterium]